MAKKFDAPTKSSVVQSTEQAQPEPKKQEYYRFNAKMPIEYKDYLQEMAWRQRTSITEYLNKLVAADMEAHPEWRDTIDILNK